MSPVNVVTMFLFTLTSSQGMSSPHSPREMLRSPLFFKPNATHPQIRVNNMHGNSSLSKGKLRQGRNIFNLIGFITGYRAGQGLAYQSQNNLNLLGRIFQMNDGKIGDENSEFYPEFPNFPTSPSYPPMLMPYWYPTFPHQIQQQYPPQHPQQYPPQHPQYPPQFPPQYPPPYPQFPSPRPPAIGGSGSNVPPTAPAPVNQQQIVNIHEPLGSDPPQDNYQEIRDDNRQQIVNNLQDPNNEYSDNASGYEDSVVTRESYDNRGRNQAENGLRQDKIKFPDTVFEHGLQHKGPINDLGHVYNRLNTNSKKAQSTSKQNNDIVVQMQTPANPSGLMTRPKPSQGSQNPKQPGEKPENEPENEDDGDEEDNTDDDENGDDNDEDDNDNDDTDDETESSDNGGETVTEDETENTTDMPTDATTMENMRPPQIQKPDSPPVNTIPETTQPTPGNGNEEHHVPPGSYGYGDVTGNISITISPLHQYEHYDDNPHHVYNPSFPYKFNNYIPTAYQDHPIKIVKPLNEEHKLWDYYKYNGDHLQTGNTYENEHQSHEPFLHNDEHEAYSPYVYNSHDNYKRGLS